MTSVSELIERGLKEFEGIDIDVARTRTVISLRCSGALSPCLDMQSECLRIITERGLIELKSFTRTSIEIDIDAFRRLGSYEAIVSIQGREVAAFSSESKEELVKKIVGSLRKLGVLDELNRYIGTAVGNMMMDLRMLMNLIESVKPIAKRAGSCVKLLDTLERDFEGGLSIMCSRDICIVNTGEGEVTINNVFGCEMEIGSARSFVYAKRGRIMLLIDASSGMSYLCFDEMRIALGEGGECLEDEAREIDALSRVLTGEGISGAKPIYEKDILVFIDDLKRVISRMIAVARYLP